MKGVSLAEKDTLRVTKNLQNNCLMSRPGFALSFRPASRFQGSLGTLSEIVDSTIGRCRVMNTEKCVGVVVFGLLTLFPLISVHGVEPALREEIPKKNEEGHYEGKEQMLGPFKLGETTKEEVRKELGEIQVGMPPLFSLRKPPVGIYYKDCWTFFIEEDSGVLIGVGYDAMDIDDSASCPRTSQGVGIGSKLDDIEKAYGPPSQLFTGRTNLILRNSELGRIHVYVSKGLWVTLTNQTPYSDSDDWRVISITVGDEGVIEHMFVGAPAYSAKPITPDRERHIIAMYEKKYGKRKDLEIYDEYALYLEGAYFEYVKSMGEHIVTIAMILPKDEKKAAVLFAEDSEGRMPIPKETENRIKKEIAMKYGISVLQLDEIVKKVEQLKTDLHMEDVEKELKGRLPDLQR